MTAISNRNKIIIAAGMLLLFLGILLSLFAGSMDLSFSDIIHGIFYYDGSNIKDQLIRDVRIPRIISAILIGGMLSLSGAAIQGVIKNPVAEPSILGVNQGAVFAVSISSVYGISSGGFGLFMMSFAGAVFSGIFLLFFLLSDSRNQTVSRMLLMGTSISMFFISMASIVAIIGNRSQELAFWISGGLRNVDWTDVVFLSVIGILFSILLILQAGKINLISLGDESAVGLGISPEKIKISTILFVIPICAVSVSVAGSISFIGLFVPHIMRKLSGSDYRYLLPLSFIYGSVLLVYSDILARTISAPYELPVGLFTTAIGIPVFLMLVRKESK